MQIVNIEVKLTTSFTYFLIFVLAILLNTIHVTSESNMLKSTYSTSMLNKKGHLTLSNQFNNNNNNNNNYQNSNLIKNPLEKKAIKSNSDNDDLSALKDSNFDRNTNKNKNSILNRYINFISKNETNKNKTIANKTSFPNSHEALTDRRYFNSTKFKAPKLSDALSEHNPNSFVTKEKFMELVKSANYQMTRGEIEQIFLTLDTKKEDHISIQQYENFKTLFILPFEACDSTGTYLLSQADFLACFKADPKSHFIDFRRRHANNLYKKLSGIVSSRADRKLNFFSYLFVKRALYAWTKCQTHRKYISLSGFKCAMEVMTQLHRKILYEDLYNVALEYQFRDGALIAPDFICFLNIAHKAFFFNIISYPNRNYLLEKSLFLKAIAEDRLPQNFKAEEVNLFYDLIDVRKSKGEVYEDIITKPSAGATEAAVSMDFRSFMFFIHYHNLMNKYSVQKPLQLTKAELLRLLDDTSVSAKIVNVIDHSLTLFDEGQHLEASLVHSTKRPNEGQFFAKFLMVGNEKEKEGANVTLASIEGKANENIVGIGIEKIKVDNKNKSDDRDYNSKNSKNNDMDLFENEERKDNDWKDNDVEMGDEFETIEAFDDNMIEEENEDYGADDEKENDYPSEKKLIQNLFLIEKTEKKSTSSNSKRTEKSKSKRNSRVSFMRQDHSVSTASLVVKNTTNATYFDISKNKKNREVFFTIFSNADKGIWSQKDFYRAFQTANLFTYFLDVDHYWRVPLKKIVGKIQEAYKDVSPSVNNLHVETNKIYPSLPAETKIDLLAFAAIENFFEKATSFNSAEAGKINELDLKIILKDFGLVKIHDPVLDIASKGYDKLGRRVFDLGILAQKIFVNQVAAAELKNDELLFKNSGLKKNEDPSRRFPQDPRRLAASPLV